MSLSSFPRPGRCPECRAHERPNGKIFHLDDCPYWEQPEAVVTDERLEAEPEPDPEPEPVIPSFEEWVASMKEERDGKP
jgi:hypothetical protein